MNTTWTPTEQQLPEKGRLVEWISERGIQSLGTYHGGGVWFPEGSAMYVYYQITYWRYV